MAWSGSHSILDKTPLTMACHLVTITVSDSASRRLVKVLVTLHQSSYHMMEIMAMVKNLLPGAHRSLAIQCHLRS